MNFIIGNWYIIIAALAIGFALGFEGFHAAEKLKEVTGADGKVNVDG